jgi:hypothetical protein
MVAFPELALEIVRATGVSSCTCQVLVVCYFLPHRSEGGHLLLLYCGSERQGDFILAFKIDR